MSMDDIAKGLLYGDGRGVNKPIYESDNKNVNPSHYKQGGMESIDVIKAFTADLKGVDAFCAGNAIKYILRFSHKNGIEDIEKAIWYLTYLKDHYKPQPKIIASFDHIPSLKEMLDATDFGVATPASMTSLYGIKPFDPNVIVSAPPIYKPTESAPDENLNTSGEHKDLPEKEKKGEIIRFPGRDSDKSQRIPHSRRNKKERK